MALTPEDMAQIAALIKGEVSASVTEATTPQPSTNDEPQNQPENQPDWYVHLANGKVIETKDSQSTHMNDPETGEAVAVIGRYAKGA
jgi:hypothetical protein